MLMVYWDFPFGLYPIGKVLVTEKQLTCLQQKFGPSTVEMNISGRYGELNEMASSSPWTD